MAGNPAFHKIIKGVVPPAAIKDNAAYTTAEIDTVDATYGKAQYTNVYVYIGAIDADFAAGAFKLQECDTSGGTFADITSATLSPVNTDDNTFWCLAVNNTAARKRYYDLVLTAPDGAAGMYCAAWVEHCFNTVQPITATGLGLTGLASV